MSSVNNKLEKVIERFNSRIEAGDYYEAHQTLRTIANRYLRAKKWEESINLITHAAQAFLKSKQGGSGTDLIFFLLEVYESAPVRCDDAAVSRLIELLVLVDCKEPNLKDVVTGMNNWSVKHGECKFGDSKLHAVIATKLLEGGFVYEAERYMVLGTRESMKQYIALIWDWYAQSDKSGKFSEFYCRPIFHYLFIWNLEYAIEAQRQLLDKFVSSENVVCEVVEKNGFSIMLFEEYPELNFMQLILIACQTKESVLFQNLKSQYPTVASKYPSELDYLGQEYFGIKIEKPVNFLQDMMSGLFGAK